LAAPTADWHRVPRPQRVTALCNRIEFLMTVSLRNALFILIASSES
jgi:hypothetical protein